MLPNGRTASALRHQHFSASLHFLNLSFFSPDNLNLSLDLPHSFIPSSPLLTMAIMSIGSFATFLIVCRTSSMHPFTKSNKANKRKKKKKKNSNLLLPRHHLLPLPLRLPNPLVHLPNSSLALRLSRIPPALPPRLPAANPAHPPHRHLPGSSRSPDQTVQTL